MVELLIDKLCTVCFSSFWCVCVWIWIFVNDVMQTGKVVRLYVCVCVSVCCHKKVLLCLPSLWSNTWTVRNAHGHGPKSCPSHHSFTYRVWFSPVKRSHTKARSHISSVMVLLSTDTRTNQFGFGVCVHWLSAVLKLIPSLLLGRLGFCLSATWLCDCYPNILVCLKVGREFVVRLCMIHSCITSKRTLLYTLECTFLIFC